MLLLFWSSRKASVATATLSARPSGLAVGAKRTNATADLHAAFIGLIFATKGTAAFRVSSLSVSTGQHDGVIQSSALHAAPQVSIESAHQTLNSAALTAVGFLTADGMSERLGVAALRVTAETPLIGVHGVLGALTLRANPDMTMTTVTFHLPPGPFDPLEPVFLGAAYRGDTLLLPMWVARDQRGIVLDLTEADVWFTAKTDLEDTDAEAPTIQCTSEAGQIQIMEPPVLGIYQVVIQPSQTQLLLDDTVFNFDVQVVTDFPRTTTVRVGTMIIVRDVTRTFT